MKKLNIWLGFDVQTTQGPVLQPHAIEFWPQTRFKSNQPDSPFHYKADALTGLSLILLNPHLQTPFVTPAPHYMNFAFAKSAWQAQEPHFEMYHRAQVRVQSVRKLGPAIMGETSLKFQAGLKEVLATAFNPKGANLDSLTELLSVFDQLETHLGGPLMYNFNFRLDSETMEILHHLHSFLFNLRSLIAMDHNAYIQDASHEALKVDSITDYLPRADYIANDAILYWQFLKSQKLMQDQAVEDLENCFNQYSHHAVCLVQKLPKAFLKELSSQHMEDSLYLAQMDWLLGTEAGLVFKIREELFGLLEGYDRVFWPDLEASAHKSPHVLSVNCEVQEGDWEQKSA
jgi:hypothetical protein